MEEGSKTVCGRRVTVVVGGSYDTVVIEADYYIVVVNRDRCGVRDGEEPCYWRVAYMVQTTVPW